MKAVVAAFNQEKALVGAFSVIVQPVVELMDRFAALILRRLGGGEGAGVNLSHSQVVSSGAERSSSRLISIIINVFRNI